MLDRIKDLYQNIKSKPEATSRLDELKQSNEGRLRVLISWIKQEYPWIKISHALGWGWSYQHYIYVNDYDLNSKLEDISFSVKESIKNYNKYHSLHICDTIWIVFSYQSTIKNPSISVGVGQTIYYELY